MTGRRNRVTGRPSRRSGHACYFDALESRILFSFGLTTTTSTYTVDTGAGLVFSVARTAGSGSVGDLTSTILNGTQLEAPFSATSRFSHYESGLSGSTVVTATIDPNGNWIEIACNDTGSTGVGVIQYYVARKGFNNIYMATEAPGPNSPSPGEMRFITYTNHSVLTNAPAPSDNNGSTGAIESSDVFGHADGTTSSKYYGEYRAIDAQVYGLTGGGFGEFMDIGNRETSSGGPFFKDIDYQTTSPQSTELYTYTFSGHSQTENFRPGLHGFYALEFTTTSTTPPPLDYSWIDTLGLGSHITGYTGASGRGTLAGTATGVPSGLQATVALSNAADQYWATPDAGGNYTIPGVLPGTYTETLYQGELAIGSVQVTLSAGHTTRQNITNDLTYHEIDQNSNPVTTPPQPNTIIAIGKRDGTPLGLLNADKISDMHPTDIRMSPWAADATGLTTFNVGTDPVSSFPMAEWHTQVGTGAQFGAFVDTDNRITFTLTAAQAATPLTLRIGVTREDHGRPTININGHASSVPNISSQPTARGLTTGNWRGNNTIYTFNLSTSNLVAGTNTLDIFCASGSTGTYYSGYQIYDAIDLVPTTSLTNAPVVTTVVVTPPTPTVNPGQQQQFTAQAHDQNGNPIPANFTWSATRGTVDGTGLYTAPATSGSDSITATSGSKSGTASVTVNAAPTVATPASASPNPAPTNATNLSILGADDAGEPNLIYTWSATGPAAVTYSVNGTNTAKNSTATFTVAGSYTFTCTITDSGGLTVTSNTTVSVFPGDANQDGHIDLTDLSIVLNNFGSTSSDWTSGNFDGAATIDLTDLSYVLNNFGATLSSPVVTTVQTLDTLPATTAADSSPATTASDATATTPTDPPTTTLIASQLTAAPQPPAAPTPPTPDVSPSVTGPTTPSKPTPAPSHPALAKPKKPALHALSAPKKPTPFTGHYRL